MNVLELTYLHDRVNAGIDVHPNPNESEEFQRLARIISPNQDWAYKGCQECLNHMVKFVFDNQNRLNEKKSTNKRKVYDAGGTGDVLE